MDHRPNKQDVKKKTSIPTGMPPLTSGRNISPLIEDSPNYRSIQLGNLQTTAGFAAIPPDSLSRSAGESFGQLKRDRDLVRRESSALEDFPVRKFEVAGKLKPVSLSYPTTPAQPAPEFHPISCKSSWTSPQLRSLPTHYPMERSNRILHEHEHRLGEVTVRLSDCFRVLGVQAKYFESPAGAALLTPEQVLMYVYLWKTGGGKQLCVEVQRRRGDSVTFHRYARHILEAASGDFEAVEYKDYTDSHYLKAAEKLLRTELANSAEQHEESLMSIELAAGLIKKDRFDARLLGMQSLCILTDPRKTSLNTALLASRVILFGILGGGEDNIMFRSLHEFVLNVIQKKCMGDEDTFLDGMVVEYDSDDEDFFEDDDEEERPSNKPPEYYDTMNTLINYGLAVLGNSLEVLTTFEAFDQEPETTTLSADTPSAAIAQFHRISYDLTSSDILTSLLMELGRAESKPHNACLAAKCLRVICQCSDEARDRAKGLYACESAYRAEEVGKQTNARLERESRELLEVIGD